MIYNHLAADGEAPIAYIARASKYDRLARKALRSTRLLIDTNADGIADQSRRLDLPTLFRT